MGAERRAGAKRRVGSGIDAATFVQVAIVALWLCPLSLFSNFLKGG